MRGRRKSGAIGAVLLTLGCGGEPASVAPAAEPTDVVTAAPATEAPSTATPATAAPATPATTVAAEAETEDAEETRRTECWPDDCLTRMDEIVAPWTLVGALGLPDPDSEPLPWDLPMWREESGLASIPDACAVDAPDGRECLGTWEVTITGIERPETGCAVATVDARLVLVIDDEPAEYGPTQHLHTDFRSIGDDEVDLDCGSLPPDDDVVRAAITTEPELARALAAELDMPATPAERSRMESLALAFFDAAHDRAEVAYRRGDHALAGDYALAALAVPAALTDGPETPALEGRLGPCARDVGCAYVPATRASITLLNDLAFYALEGSPGAQIGAVIAVLEAIVALSPERASARLNLADALWVDNRYPDAVREYQRYLELRGGRGPERVAARIARGHPPDPPPVEALDDGRTRGVVSLGALDGAELSVETTCEEAGSGYEECTIVLRAQRGEVVREATALEGEIGYVSVSGVRATLEGDTIVLRHPATEGRFEDSGLATQRWTYDDTNGFTHVSTHVEESGWESGLADFHSAARTGDLERARGIRAAIGESGTGGHTTEIEAMEWSMFAGRLVVARRLEGDDAGTVLRSAVRELEAARARMENGGGGAEVIDAERAASLRTAIRQLRRLGGDANLAAATLLESGPTGR